LDELNAALVAMTQLEITTRHKEALWAHQVMEIKAFNRLHSVMAQRRRLSDAQKIARDRDYLSRANALPGLRLSNADNQQALILIIGIVRSLLTPPPPNHKAGGAFVKAESEPQIVSPDLEALPIKK
jgi:hypothetical protein